MVTTTLHYIHDPLCLGNPAAWVEWLRRQLFH